MATVEELRAKAEKLKATLTNSLSLGLRMALGSDERHDDLVRDINELADAFHAEGVAEGIDAAQRWIDSEFNRGRHVLSLPKDTLLVSLLAPDKESGRAQEIQWLRSDIAAIDKLLAALPVDHVIERLGFESKKQEEMERLAVLAPDKERKK